MSNKTLSVNHQVYGQLVIYAAKQTIKLKKPVSLSKAIGILLQNNMQFEDRYKGMLSNLPKGY